MYHVLNRSVAKMHLFGKDADFEAFQRVMIEAHQRHPIRILSDCVLSNRWHFAVWPDADGQVTAFCRWLAHTHAMRWRVAHRTVGHGHLYQGRFKSFPVQSDEHLLTVLRYIERNAGDGNRDAASIDGSQLSSGDTIPNCLGELGEISGENRWRVRGIRAGFPVFATCPVVISAHSQTIANQGEKKAGHCEFHSSRKTSSTASSPGPFKIHSRPLQPRPEWAACWSLVAQAPGQKGAIVPESSEPRRVDTKPLTTDAPLPVWGTRQGIYCPIAVIWGWRLVRAGSPDHCGDHLQRRNFVEA